MHWIIAKKKKAILLARNGRGNLLVAVSDKKNCKNVICLQMKKKNKIAVSNSLRMESSIYSFEIWSRHDASN